MYIYTEDESVVGDKMKPIIKTLVENEDGDLVIAFTEDEVEELGLDEEGSQILGSSVVEQMTVNHRVAGSNPARGASL
jgi:hypothetical protein